MTDQTSNASPAVQHQPGLQHAEPHHFSFAHVVGSWQAWWRTPVVGTVDQAEVIALSSLQTVTSEIAARTRPNLIAIALIVAIMARLYGFRTNLFCRNAAHACRWWESW
jgi:hypothetical protein